jgi:hypothetical protein
VTTKLRVDALAPAEDAEARKARVARQGRVARSCVNSRRIGATDALMATVSVAALAAAHVSTHLMDARRARGRCSHSNASTYATSPKFPPASDFFSSAARCLHPRGREIQAKLDTAVVVSDTIDPSWTAGSPTVVVGIAWAQSQASTWAVRYDNVLVDWQ